MPTKIHPLHAEDTPSHDNAQSKTNDKYKTEDPDQAHVSSQPQGQAQPSSKSQHDEEPGSDAISSTKTPHVGRKRSSSLRIGEMATRAAELAFSRESAEVDAAQHDDATCLIPVDGAFHTVWDVVLLIMIVYVTFVMPLSLALDLEPGALTPWTALATMDFVIDAVFLTDVVLNFHTTFIDKDGNEVRDVKLIRKNYLKTWFAVDVLSALPFGIVQVVAVYVANGGGTDSASVNEALYRLQALRFLKLARLVKTLRVLTKTVGMEVSKNLRRLARDLGILVVLLHFTACVYVGTAYYAGTPDSLHGSWVVAFLPDIGTLEHSELNVELYISGLYWAVATLTTVGFGDVSPENRTERIVTICTMLICAAYYGYLIASMASVVSSWDTNTAKLNERMTNLMAYTKAKRFPRKLRRKIEGYYRQYYTTQHTVDEVEVLTGLSVSLRREVTDFLLHDVKGEMLSSLVIFQGIDRSTLGKLFLALTPNHFAANDKIMEVGTSERNLFILLSGSVAIDCTHTPDQPTSTLHPGAPFGEMQFLGLRQTSVFTLTATEQCKVWTVSRKEFHRILDATDDTLARIVSSAMGVYQKYYELFQQDPAREIEGRMTKYLAEVARFDVIEQQRTQLRRLETSSSTSVSSLMPAFDESASTSQSSAAESMPHAERRPTANFEGTLRAQVSPTTMPTGVNISALVRGRPSSGSFLDTTMEMDRQPTITAFGLNSVYPQRRLPNVVAQLSRKLSVLHDKVESRIATLTARVDKLDAWPGITQD